MTLQLAISPEIYALYKLLKKFSDFRIVIAGRIKSGKSALMYHLAELWHKFNPKKKIYVVNFPEQFRYLLPSWIASITKYELDQVYDSLILIEEGVLVAHSRNWFTSFNKELSKLFAKSITLQSFGKLLTKFLV